MAVEQSRGCGFRKVGGLYLCGSGRSLSCDRLPYELVTCPTCGEGIKFTRGFQWLNWYEYAGRHGGCLEVIPTCPVCEPVEQDQPYGLIWVGESFYTPESFVKEALEQGVSRRISAIPRKLKLGQTWVLLAHRIACGEGVGSETGLPIVIPGVFYVFRPQSVELLIWRSQATPEYLEELDKKGITPVVIPDGDLDHDPATTLSPSIEEKATIDNTRFFAGLRDRLRG